MRPSLAFAISALALCASAPLAQDAMTPANQQPAAAQPAPTEQTTPAEQPATPIEEPAPAEQPTTAVDQQPPAPDANVQMPDIPADADNLIGKQLVTAAGEEVGEVADLLVTSDGRVEAILVRRGGVLGMGETHVSLTWDQIEIQGDQISTTLTADQIEALPDYAIE